MRLPPTQSSEHLNGLAGSWSATRWQYTSRIAPQRVADLICDLGASITLSLAADSFILTWAFGNGERGTVGGTVRLTGEQLELVPREELALPPAEVSFRLGPDELALSSDNSAWQFEGDGSDALAAWVAVFVRM